MTLHTFKTQNWILGLIFVLTPAAHALNVEHVKTDELAKVIEQRLKDLQGPDSNFKLSVSDLRASGSARNIYHPVLNLFLFRNSESDSMNVTFRVTLKGRGLFDPNPDNTPYRVECSVLDEYHQARLNISNCVWKSRAGYEIDSFGEFFDLGYRMDWSTNSRYSVDYEHIAEHLGFHDDGLAVNYTAGKHYSIDTSDQERAEYEQREQEIWDDINNADSYGIRVDRPDAR